MGKDEFALLRILFYITLFLIASAHWVIAFGYVHQIFMTSLQKLKLLNLLFLEKYPRTIQTVDWSLLAHSFEEHNFDPRCVVEVAGAIPEYQQCAARAGCPFPGAETREGFMRDRHGTY